LPYSGCATRRSTATTTVFDILSLTTRPTRVLRRPRSCSWFWSCVSAIVQLPLTQDRAHPRDVPPQRLDQARVLELLRRTAETQSEQLLACVRNSVLDLLDREIPDLRRLHSAPPSPARSRSTTFDLTGSLAAASAKASRASSSGTPSISNITRPGLTTATHISGLPLPFPMRVTSGFFVTGLSGNTCVQTLPPRLMWLVFAVRAASICRFVTQPGSVACSP